MTACRFLDPLDVLFLRGNKLFGDPGSYGESLVPPWPSVAAGAIRSQMLAADGIDLVAFARGQASHPVLGNRDHPQAFVVSAFHLARRRRDRVEALYPLPADLIARKREQTITLQPLRPAAPARGIEGSHPLGHWPLLATDGQAKPERGLWLTEAGWRRYLTGDVPQQDEVLRSDALWKIDSRVGVGLHATKRSSEDGKLFTVQAVAPVRAGHVIDREAEPSRPVIVDYDTGFLAIIDGADPPTDGTLRLGGDGRGAVVHAVDYQPIEPDYAAIGQTGSARIILTSPGIFPDGWRLPGMDTDGRFELLGVRGQVVSAAVPRAETVSGWDLARWGPKPAQRAAPAGSVYWIEQLQATPAQLRKLAAHGLWPEQGYDALRRAEGFNRFTFATY